MSLDNIILPAETLAGLYGKHLYIIPGSTAPKQAAKPAPVNQPVENEPIITIQPTAEPAAATWLGGNKQRVLILVNDLGAVHIDAAPLDTLTRILGACKLTLDDVAIMNTAARPVAWQTVKAQLAPESCILFNVSPDAIGLPMIFPPYHQHQYGGCRFLLSDGLVEISSNALLKSKLWICLKAMFGI